MTNFLSLPIELIIQIIKESISELPEILLITELIPILKSFLTIVTDYSHDFLKDPLLEQLHYDIKRFHTWQLIPYLESSPEQKKRKLSQFLPTSADSILFISLHAPETSLPSLYKVIPKSCHKFVSIYDCCSCFSPSKGSLTRTYKGSEIKLNNLDDLISLDHHFHIEFNQVRVPYVGHFTTQILQHSTIRSLYIYQPMVWYSFSSISKTENGRNIDNETSLDLLFFDKLTELHFENFRDTIFMKFLLKRAPKLKKLSIKDSGQEKFVKDSLHGLTFPQLETLYVDSVYSIRNLNLPNLQKFVYKSSNIEKSSRKYQYHYSLSRPSKRQSYQLEFISCPKLETFSLEDYALETLPNILHFDVPSNVHLEILGIDIDHSKNPFNQGLKQFINKIRHLAIDSTVLSPENIDSKVLELLLPLQSLEIRISAYHLLQAYKPSYELDLPNLQTLILKPEKSIMNKFKWSISVHICQLKQLCFHFPLDFQLKDTDFSYLEDQLSEITSLVLVFNLTMKPDHHFKICFYQQVIDLIRGWQKIKNVEIRGLGLIEEIPQQQNDVNIQFI